MSPKSTSVTTTTSHVTPIREGRFHALPSSLRRGENFILERAERIELSSIGWKPTALPLCYARLLFVIDYKSSIIYNLILIGQQKLVNRNLKMNISEIAAAAKSASIRLAAVKTDIKNIE